MVKHYVYKIKDKKTDIVVYVGETQNPTLRWNSHTNCLGKFNRKEYYMDVVDEFIFTNQKEAYKYQCELQKHYGFETDYEKVKKGRDKQKKKIIAYHKDTNKIAGKFNSITEASIKLKVNKSSISQILNSTKKRYTGWQILWCDIEWKYKQFGGYYFKYF